MKKKIEKEKTATYLQRNATDKASHLVYPRHHTGVYSVTPLNRLLGKRPETSDLVPRSIIPKKDSAASKQ